jgi:beta-glucosidase
VQLPGASSQAIHFTPFYPFSVGSNLNKPHHTHPANKQHPAILQRINSTWSCANSHWLTDVLKGELGFDGFVVSDWGAQHGTVDFALGGLDMEQEWVENSTYYGAALAAAVEAGEVSQMRLDDMANRVLLAMYALNFTAEPPASANSSVPTNTTEHAELALDLARASIVLLKNGGDSSGPVAPLQPGELPRGITVFDVAGAIISGGGSGGVLPPFLTRPSAGIAAAFGDGVPVSEGDTTNLTKAAAAAAASDASVVIVGIHSGEGADRANLSLGSGQDELIAAIAAAQPNTIVVVRCPGACLMPWIDAVPVVFNRASLCLPLSLSSLSSLSLSLSLSSLLLPTPRTPTNL